MRHDPRNCTCGCHKGENIFCSCFGSCCDEPYWTPEKSAVLLDRDTFRESVFKRDHHQCVICKAPAKDAHHILERRLWGDGGYYMANGASVCEEHHLAAERTTLTCEEVREAAGIKDTLLPKHLTCGNPRCSGSPLVIPFDYASEGTTPETDLHEVRPAGGGEDYEREVQGVSSLLRGASGLAPQTRVLTSERLEGGQTLHGGRIRSGASSESDEGAEAGFQLHPGTPSGDGSASRASAESEGSSASPERDSRRQPSGELGGTRAERRSRKQNLRQSTTAAYSRLGSVTLCHGLKECQRYDKWGNPVLANGTRLRGDLFFDESVQKVLGEGNVLNLFTTHIKFPRTYHLPWSPGMTKDDRMMESQNPFNMEVVVATVKMDGENTTIYSDGVHARSLDYEPHPSRNWMKATAARVAHDIPEGWRVCGENLWAEHSIAYKNLDDFFLVFQVWNENVCLSWNETKEWAALLGFKTVPVIYEGAGDRKLIENLHQQEFQGDPMEGYVVRRAGTLAYSEYRRAVGKFVRAGHNTSTHDWKRQKVKPNALREAP